MPTISLASLKFTSQVNAFGPSPERGIYTLCCDEERPRSLHEKKQDLGFSRQFIELQTVPLNATQLLVKAPVSSHELQCDMLYFVVFDDCAVQNTPTHTFLALALCSTSTSLQASMLPGRRTCQSLCNLTNLTLNPSENRFCIFYFI